VSDRDAVGRTFAKVAADRGDVDILVCSAGVARPGYFEELPDEVFREMIDIDYFGTLWPIREVVPGMIERRSGSIVGISSDVGLVGVYGYTAYAAAKFAVRGLLESLRAELAPHGIHVGCCYPPDTDTPQLAGRTSSSPRRPAHAATFKAIQPEQVADCIVKGIEKERFALMPDLGSRMLSIGAGLAPASSPGHGPHRPQDPARPGLQPTVSEIAEGRRRESAPPWERRRRSAWPTRPPFRSTARRAPRSSGGCCS
jgi:3-dehydrosphinganine reductase